MENLATQKQLSYLSYLIKDFVPSETLTLKEASIMIAKALKERRKEKDKEEKKQGSNKKEIKKEVTNKYGVKVGDVFGFSFGYDATYYVFFEVTRLVGACSVEIREISKKQVEGGYSANDWKIKPCKGSYLDKSHFLDNKASAIKKIVLLKYDNNKPSIAISNGYYHATKCDENAVYSEDDYH